MQHFKRAQTLPLWLGNVFLTCVFAFAIGSYGNVIAYQFRAQTIADSAANAAVAIQSQEFNQMLEGLYASGVEEYRLRHTLEGIRISSMYSGGCHNSSQNNCGKVYVKLVHAYKAALFRYDNDARFVSRVTYNMNKKNLTSDITQIITAINGSCMGGANGVNSIEEFSCGTTSRDQYHVSLVTPGGTNPAFRSVKAAAEDAYDIYLPSYSTKVSSTPTKANPNFFAPVAVEVQVCTVVPPIFPTMFNAGSTVVVARAAATNAQVEEDWLQPGAVTSPWSGGLFQAEEKYGDDGSYYLDDNKTKVAHNWYNIDFGGNPATIGGFNGHDPMSTSIKEAFSKDEYSARTGWWAPVPILPFIQQATTAKMTGCS